MANKARESLEKRAQKAILQHAVFRWESAVVIALTLLLTAFGPNLIEFLPNWAWLLCGLIAEGVLVYSSLSDSEANRMVIAEMLHDEYRPERLNDKRLQQRVEEALDYRGRITTAIRERRDTLLKDELSQTAGQIDEWLGNVYNLAQRLDRYQEEKEVLERDKKRAIEDIRKYEQKARIEQDPMVQQQIIETIEGKQRQIQTIESLENTMERAELQLESTMSALGTIYSQTMLVDAKDIDSGRAKRLRQEIGEEVQELDNVLLAMDEVYASSQL